VTGAGGTITVESTEGEGSAFHVYFPRSANEQGPSAADTGAQIGGGRGETVLLVEDEAAVRSTARRTLERSGYQVLEARHGADALLVWSRARDSIDLVVTDVRMPEMDGPELVAALRAERPNLPVLFTSGYLTGPVAAEIAAAEEACLAKPFSSSELVQRVRRLLDRAAESAHR
jgi:CheY-like chemotaxis protein